MAKRNISCEYDVYENINELSQEYRDLIDAAYEALLSSYAPYSNFSVGAALLLENGKVIGGSNQENASYPLGLCAERTALSTAASLASSEKISAIAIVANNSKEDVIPPTAPCGICRQALLEAELKHKHNIKIILCGTNNEVFVFDSIKKLLPLHFDGEFLD